MRNHNHGLQDVIINSGYAASCYLSEMKDKGSHNIGKIFCLGSESLMEELEMAGLSVLKKEASLAAMLMLSRSYKCYALARP